ncbi:MAG: hypothetical protein HUU45_13360 [Leptospiraceae bacterium]|nr:hypothetical protein [Leptospiraceae bacterium]
MAEASWIYKVTDKSRDYKATKNSSGKFLLTAATFDEFTGTYSKTVAKFVSNNMFDDAKYILRLIQGAEKRGLEEIRYSHFIMVAGSKLELYRVYISIPMLDSKIPGWREALVYDVGDHDILDNEVAKKVVEEVMNNWKIEVNNSSQIKL